KYFISLGPDLDTMLREYANKESLAFENNTDNDVNIEEIVKQVIRGDWGNGIARKKNLEKAGYKYVDIQRKVNEYYEG
ncbi:hypothetical protein IR145_09180, partial [Streptococcus danieliae]|nr:hypothetical protein [Streptococcus danieliae]